MFPCEKANYNFHTFSRVCKILSFSGVSREQSLFFLLLLFSKPSDWAQFKQAAGKAPGLQRRYQSDINPLITVSARVLISTFVKTINSR